ncbi:MAG: hypothetical protein M0031_10985 [Thermaerobacter sp.]|nr:hypothetical protein [Thermaerobacter sp.]
MPEHPANPGYAVDDEPRKTRDRILSKPLRLLLALGVAEVIIGVFIGLIGHGDRFGWAITIPAKQLYAVPVAWLPLATLLICFGWAFVLAGVLFGKTWMRIGVAALWLVATIGGDSIDVTLHPLLFLLPVVLPLVALFWHGWTNKREIYGVREYLMFLITSVSYYGLMAHFAVASFGANRGLVIYAADLVGQFATLVMVSFPVLLLTGKELGAFAEIVGKHALRPLENWGNRSLALLLAGLSLSGVVYIFLAWNRKYPLSGGDVLSVLAVALIGWLAPKFTRGRFTYGPPAFLLVIPALAAVLFLVLGSVSQAALGNPGSAWFTFSTGALAAGLVVFLIRGWLNRRWPGAGDGLLLVSIWSAWIFLGATKLSAWSLTMRGLEIAVALGSLAVALVALRGKGAGSEIRKNIFTVLDIILLLIVIIAIYLLLESQAVDLVSLYADTLGLFVVFSAILAWVSHNPRYRLPALVAGVPILLAAAGLIILKPAAAWTAVQRLQLVLVAAALLSKVPRAEDEYSSSFGDSAPAGSATLLYVGYVIMLVAVLGLFMAADPEILDLKDIHFDLVFGMTAIYLPLVLWAKLGHIRWGEGVRPPCSVPKTVGADDK